MGKMKEISIELEEAGLDPFDNSNLQGYVDDTHHFGEEIITSLKVEYGKQLHEEAEALLMGTNTGKQAVGLLRPYDVLKDLYPHRINIDLAHPSVKLELQGSNVQLDAKFNEEFQKIVNARTIGKSLMRQQLGRISRQLDRYIYSGRLAKGRLHYDVIDRHTREVVNTYRQVRKAKALVKELNRG